MISRRNLTTLVVAFCAAALAAPSIASASHIQGGSINSRITSTGRLQGTVTFLTANPCFNNVGDPAIEMPSLTAKNPSNVSRSIALTGTYTRCLASGSTATGTFDVDIATLWGSAPDGAYTLAATGSARVSGILNASGTTATFNSRVTKGLGASASPVINSGVATAVAKGYAYKQNLNGSDPDGTAVTYQSRAGQTGGPTFDIVSIGSTGLVSMTSSQTNTYNDGDHFTYQVRVIDGQGDYSERDTLLTVTSNNAPPSINGLPSSAINATAGAGAQTVNFTADDPNNASPKIDTVSLALAAGAPAWVSLSAPAGNPAGATLTVNPPGSVPAGTYSFNVDGVDSDTTVPLFASEQVQVTVANALPETTVGATKPASVSNSTAPSFTFGSDDNGATYECQLDSGSWAACASPKTYTGVAEGTHTFRVRAIDGANQADASPDSYTWTVDTTAPVAPSVGTSPTGTSSASTFEFTPPGDAARVECQVDGGSWVTCASPFAPAGLADGDHTVALRSVDAAGNATGLPATVAWTLDTTAPAVPALTQAPSAVAQVATFAFGIDAGATAECQLDGGDWIACTSPFTPAGIADGSHTVAVRAVDAAGNRSQGATTTWTLDTAAPAAPAFTAGPVGSTTARSATFDWTSEPGASFECKLDDGAWAACAAPFAVSGLATGKHTFSVRQTDAAGNASVAGTSEWTVGENPTPEPPKSVAPVLGQNATVAVKGDAASVGCQVDGGHLASCVVDVYAQVGGGNSGFGLEKTTATASGLVKIGTGRVFAKKGASRLSVDITLNAVGRKLMATKLAGVPVVLKIEAKTIEGPRLKVRKNAKLVPAHQLIVPTAGLFASGKSRVQPKASKLLKTIAKQLRRVKAIRCIGHTDSIGTPTANEKLGYARARAVCKALRKYGVKTAMSVASAGERQPRATNATARGRSLNRRVEISVRYR